MLLLANSIAIFHGVWTVALLLGTVLGVLGYFRAHPRLLMAYGSMVSINAISTALIGYCFLAVWERNLRLAADPSAVWNDGGFLTHYLSQVGIQVSDPQVFILVNIALLIGLFGSLIWQLHDKDLIHLRFSLLVITALLVSAIPWIQAQAGGGGGGGGGGGPSCDDLADFSGLVDTYLAEIPVDPQGETTDGAGFEVVGDGLGGFTVSAPDAELSETIEITR